ncbi:MAG: hypothetical protein JWL77_4423 [Chthonomonadaceae bacterium]|nr:hypothetical protein [Chthonomonadaceae bacterium]
MQIVHRADQEPELFEAFFVRQVKTMLHPPPEDCVQLWPLEPITGSTANEARDKALLILEIAASGRQDERFEKRPCPVPLQRIMVKEIEADTHRAFARIYKHSDTRYEVRYFGAIIGDDDEEGWRLSVPPVEDQPVPPGFVMLTLADSVTGAEQTALLELQWIVRFERIKRR